MRVSAWFLNQANGWRALAIVRARRPDAYLFRDQIEDAWCVLCD